MTLPIIIGVAGRDRAGKSTVAAALAAHGYTVINFADTLKDMAVAIDPPIEDPNTGRVYGLASLVQEYGWEVVKDRFPGARRFLRRLATEGVREHLDPNAWVTAWRKRVMQHRDASEDTVPVVAGDVRFRNEADAIIASGGQIWLVDRPLLTADGEQHVSENPLPDELITRTIRNDGTVEDLTERVEKLISELTAITLSPIRTFQRRSHLMAVVQWDGRDETLQAARAWLDKRNERVAPADADQLIDTNEVADRWSFELGCYILPPPTNRRQRILAWAPPPDKERSLILIRSGGSAVEVAKMSDWLVVKNSKNPSYSFLVYENNEFIENYYEVSDVDVNQ